MLGAQNWHKMDSREEEGDEGRTSTTPVVIVTVVILWKRHVCRKRGGRGGYQMPSAPARETEVRASGVKC
jgi:hypothetical protein